MMGWPAWATSSSPAPAHCRATEKSAWAWLPASPCTKVLTEIGHVAEGVPTIDEVFNTACRHQIDMPITQTLYELVRNELSAKDVAERLMMREAKSE